MPACACVFHGYASRICPRIQSPINPSIRDRAACMPAYGHYEQLELCVLRYCGCYCGCYCGWLVLPSPPLLLGA